jgi:glutathione synthase/RimK-type ligase-like ATP-grasp enzyme
MKIAFQMDDLSKLDFSTDSTISLIIESQIRGNKNYIYSPESLLVIKNEVYANVSNILFINNNKRNYKCSKKKTFKII